MQAEQHDAGQACPDLYEAVAGLKRRHDLHPCAVRPRDGLALRSDAEREIVQDLVKRYRDLPPDEQRRLPALLNSLAQLEIVVGDMEAGQHDFQEVARIVADPISQAEAHRNVHLAALERRDWDEALLALRRAAVLDPDALEPFPLSRYEPIRVLGAGGFGVSFLCHDRNASAGANANRRDKVVVKTLRSDALDHGTDIVIRECGWIRELDHPALIGVVDAGWVDAEKTRPFLVLEYFEGQTLMDYIAQHGPLAPEDWLAIGWQIGRAVQSLHGRGILHRSIRPSAVLVRREPGDEGKSRWRVKVLDAGLSLKRTVIHASASNPAARVQTALGRSVARTIGYAPPEVVGKPKGDVWVGPHSDVYSFGRLSAFALTGRPDPDGGDLVALPEPWKRFLDDLTSWIIRSRPSHFGEVMDRLSQLPGARELVGAVERAMFDATIADRTAALVADPADVEALTSRANAYMRQGDWAKAADDWTRALQLRPDDASLYRRRGLVHARLGAHDRAISDFTESLRLEPRNLEALANRALSHAQRKEHDRAAADYTEAIGLNNRDEALYCNRGNAHYCLALYDRAIADYTEAIRLDPHSAWAIGNRGKAYALCGDHARAVADFGRVLHLDPKNVKAVWDRALSYVELGQFEKALPDYDAAIRMEPNAALYQERGQARLAVGQKEEAITDLTEALALDPNSIAAYVARAGVYAGLDAEKALVDLNEALRLQPEWADALVLRGDIQATRGAFQDAIADYTQALQLKADQADIHLCRAKAHAAVGDYDAAVADCTTAIRLYAGAPKTDATQLADAHIHRGRAHIAWGDAEPALADFHEAVRLDPLNGAAYAGRAVVYARLRDPEKALADYGEAIRLHAADAAAFTGRGDAYTDLGDLDRALADYEQALQLNPRSAKAVLGRGLARSRLDDVDGALADFGETAHLQPDCATAHYNRACILVLCGETDEALTALNEAVRLEPGHTAALNNRGNLLQRRGQLDAALADYDAALAVAPPTDAAYLAVLRVNRAALRLMRGDREGAMADYTEALRLNPDDAAAYHGRGRLFAEMGDLQNAIADNEEALRRAPDDPRTLNNRAWLSATAPNPQAEELARAEEYARKACAASNGQEPAYLDTLAAVLASVGKYASAVEVQRRAAELAPEVEKVDYQSRLSLYAEGRRCVS
ncbi:MAG TPA: tetratricopeptide repeat protein [Gemmataceae bacterium]|nr:tetratricopeptide repeat protein [Gemmataceae bacterium]